MVVGFPATPLLLSRARVCISASHTREELAAALLVMEDLVDLLGLRYVKNRLAAAEKEEPPVEEACPAEPAVLTSGHG